MLSLWTVKTIVHNGGLSQTEKLLICLAVDADRAKQVADVRKIAVDAGVRQASKWNISTLLSRTQGLAIRINDGWELTSEGRDRVKIIANARIPGAPAKMAPRLRAYLTTVTSATTHEFLDEAVGCMEANFHRAAVVLTWIGAVSVLYDYVHANHLASFNAEALRRDAKWKPAKTKDDLARMNEHAFLQVLHAISVIGKSTKDELEGCLKLRNGCGHPNSFKVGEARVTAHIESLIQNVYSVF